MLSNRKSQPASEPQTVGLADVCDYHDNHPASHNLLLTWDQSRWQPVQQGIPDIPLQAQGVPRMSPAASV